MKQEVLREQVQPPELQGPAALMAVRIDLDATQRPDEVFLQAIDSLCGAGVRAPYGRISWPAVPARLMLPEALESEGADEASQRHFLLHGEAIGAV